MEILLQFVRRLIGNMGSCDPRERDSAKSCVHRAYGRFMPVRSFVRKILKETMVSVAYDTSSTPFHGTTEVSFPCSPCHGYIHFAVPSHAATGAAFSLAPACVLCQTLQMLEFYGCIVNGFVSPIKAEHKALLIGGLLPLHRCKPLGTYHRQLVYCVTQFLGKAPDLVSEVLPYLLSHWPKNNAPKELLYISELEAIMRVIDAPNLESIFGTACRRIARCAQSVHFMVAERSLGFWNNQVFLQQVCPPLPRQPGNAHVHSIAGCLWGCGSVWGMHARAARYVLTLLPSPGACYSRSARISNNSFRFWRPPYTTTTSGIGVGASTTTTITRWRCVAPYRTEAGLLLPL